MAKRSTDPARVDTSQFGSIGEAIDCISVERPFEEVARKILHTYSELSGEASLIFAFFSSAVSRARALHEAIVREIQAANPPASISLLRQFAETVAMTFYIADHPTYVESLATRPEVRLPNAPRRKSMQKLVSHMDRNYTHQFGLVYADMCEMTHFGTSALWSSHRIASDDAGNHTLTWSSEPSWKTDEDALICCALLLELSDGMNSGLIKLGKTMVEPLKGASIPGSPE